MDMDPRARQHFAKQHMEEAAKHVSAVGEQLAKEAEETKRSLERFYTNLAMFSGGTIALSVTYLGYLKTVSQPVGKALLIGSWGAFVVCVVLSLSWPFINTYYLHYARQEEYAEANKERYEAELKEFRYLNVANLRTKSEIEKFEKPRREAVTTSQENAQRNGEKKKTYFILWKWDGRIALFSFLLGLVLLLVFAIRNT